MSSNPSPKTSRFSSYTNTLKALSKRTGTPLPSLILSFGILHEITAVVPLVGVFYASRALGVGETIVNNVIRDTAPSHSETGSVLHVEDGEVAKAVRWGKEKVRSWVEEGDRWAEKVGRRYGVFGYEKRRPRETQDSSEVMRPGHRIAGDVANAVVAYGVTKVSGQFRRRGEMAWLMVLWIISIRLCYP
jgi:hypothetical protein